MKSAFISHATADRELTEKISEMLEARGIECWIAPRDLIPGRDYGEEIIRGIEETSATILILSENANNSTFVKKEIERAVSKSKPVFPVRIRQVMPSPGLELFISSAHWVDAWLPPMDVKMDQLANSIRPLIGMQPQPIRRRNSIIGLRSTMLLLGAVSLLSVGAAAYLFVNRVHDKSPDTATSPASAPATITSKTPESTVTAPRTYPANWPPIGGASPPSSSNPAPAPHLTSPQSQANSPVPPAQLSTTAPPNQTATETSVPSRHNTSGLSVSEAESLLKGTSDYSRTKSINALANKIQPNLTGAEVGIILDGLTGADRHTGITHLIRANRIRYELTTDEATLLLKGLTDYWRLETIRALANNIPANLSGADVAKIVANLDGRDRSNAVLSLARVNKIKRPMSSIDMEAVLTGTTDDSRFEIIKLLSN